ncbi:MAG TPA: hypothetical protein VGJ55_15620 [Pyrinomonadaceae bacterium]
MSELAEKRWAVISERGCEASSLTYAAAHGLVRRLVAEGLHGISIITDEAANRITKKKATPENVPESL